MLALASSADPVAGPRLRSRTGGKRGRKDGEAEPKAARRPRARTARSRAARRDLRTQPLGRSTVIGENHTRVIPMSAGGDTHLSTGFSHWGSAGERHSDKESSGTTSGSGFPTGFPLGAEAP